MIIRITLLIFLLSFSILSRENYNKSLNKTDDTQYSVFLSESELITIKSLFEQNQIDYANYQFFKLKVDELGYHQLKIHQLTENTKSGNQAYAYDKNYYYHILSKSLIKSINLNERLLVSQSEEYGKHLITLNDEDFCISNDVDKILSCLELEFGYYDLNAKKSYMNENFTSIWLVEPIENPKAYVDYISANSIFNVN